MKYQYDTQQLSKMAACEWLTDREKQVFELYYRRGWAIEDIAAELYVSRSTINTALKRIRLKST